MDSCTALTEVFNLPKFTLGVSVYFQEGLPKAYSLILARNLYFSDTQKLLQLLRNSSEDKTFSIQFGTNNTQNVANLGDNWWKVRWRHLVPNEP